MKAWNILESARQTVKNFPTMQIYDYLEFALLDILFQEVSMLFARVDSDRRNRKFYSMIESMIKCKEMLPVWLCLNKDPFI